MGEDLPKASSEDGVRFTESLRIRCPSTLPLAIDRAAAKHLMTTSEYVRRSVIERLKIDGIDPAEVHGHLSSAQAQAGPGDRV